MIKRIAPLLLTVLLAHQASATLTIDIQTGVLRTSSGTVVPTNTTAMLVSNTSGFSDLASLGTQLNGLTLQVGNTFGTTGKILSIVGTSDIDSPNGRIGYVDNVSLNLASLGLTGAAGTAGTDLAILWFPGLTGTASQTLSNGQSFGYFRSDTAGFGDSSFNVPTDGFSYTLYEYDSATATALGGSGGYAPATFNAQGTVGAGVIPEPSRMSLALFGFIALLSRRQRKLR